MADIRSLLSALDERTIAREVAIPHDELRMRYPLRSNTVTDFDEFTDLIGDYYNHHFTSCISGGRCCFGSYLSGWTRLRREG